MRYVDPDGRFIGTAIGTIVGGIREHMRLIRMALMFGQGLQKEW